MKIELKTKWVEALRSGKYEQHRGSLIAGYEDGCRAFCCLGVLLFSEETAGPEANAAYEKLMCGLGMHGLKLVSMNDSDERTFPEIADYIEANL